MGALLRMQCMQHMRSLTIELLSQDCVLNCLALPPALAQFQVYNQEQDSSLKVDWTLMAIAFATLQNLQSLHISADHFEDITFLWDTLGKLTALTELKFEWVIIGVTSRWIGTILSSFHQL